MHKLVVLLLLAGCLEAQDIARLSRAQAVRAELRTTRVGFILRSRPQAGDRFVIRVGAEPVRAALVVPDGLRINQGLNSAGVTWTAAQDAAEFGRSILVEFIEPGKAGPYVFEFDSGSIRARSRVHVRFLAKLL